MGELFLIAGLGNPGKDYGRTRHNVGFMVVERLAREWKANWSSESRFKARLAQADYERRKALLCEPQTYMNLSGEAVVAVANFYKVPVADTLVVVDDADLPLGQVRLRPSGSSGGHHGLDSIERHLGTRQYPRLRIGIGRQPGGAREITGYVLGRFSESETGLLEMVLSRVTSQISCWLSWGIQKAMNEFNGAVSAPTTKDSK